jgi:hypothetical protein
VGFQAGGDGGAGAVPGFGPTRPGPTLTEAFAQGGVWDTCPPSAALAMALEKASGPGQRCAGASRDELVGLLRQWAALESWAAAGRLGVLRALIRDEDQPRADHGDPPDQWTKSLSYEVAAALAVSAPTADNMMWLARDLDTRLPGIGGLLSAGILTCAKARAVDETFQLLSPENAARAEALILPELPGKNYGQVKKLAEQAAVTVDPDAAARRREQAEREKSRVQLFREDSGAAGLSGRDLPTDQALAAHARVSARAQQYKESGAFPAARMDQLRAAAYLDLLNAITADARIAAGVLPGAASTGPAPDDPGDSDAAGTGPQKPPGGSGPDEKRPDGGEPDGAGPGDGGPGGGGPDDAPDPGHGTPSAAPLRLTDLVLPLTTLLGLTRRPGEGHGLGPLDPGLCQTLAAAAAASADSRFCVTVTDADGIAIGHGCAKPRRTEPAAIPAVSQADPLAALPARVNLTIPAASLTGLAGSTGPPGRASWSFTQARDRAEDAGPPGGFGRWVLTLPGGRVLTVSLDPVPTFDCDHRNQSHAYQPNDTLRHLVQIRDYECTFPQCSRHARESDFEHARPYDQGGPTCACNAGARSRQCHRVKQSEGWHVTQPRPGWHQWQIPAGRVYIQGPKRYPA